MCCGDVGAAGCVSRRRATMHFLPRLPDAHAKDSRCAARQRAAVLALCASCTLSALAPETVSLSPPQHRLRPHTHMLPSAVCDVLHAMLCVLRLVFAACIACNCRFTTMTFRFPTLMSLPVMTVGNQYSSCYTLWTLGDEEESLAAGGAIAASHVIMNPLGHEYHGNKITSNEATVIRTAHVAQVIGYVRAVKMHNPAKYADYVKSGRALGALTAPMHSVLKDTPDDLEDMPVIPTDTDIERADRNHLSAIACSLGAEELYPKRKSSLKKSRDLVKLISKVSRAQREQVKGVYAKRMF